MANTLPSPTRDSQKTPVIVILQDFRVALHLQPEHVILWYIDPLLTHFKKANQTPCVSLHFIRSPFEHHLTLTPIAFPSSFGRVWFSPLHQHPCPGHPLLAV